VKTGERRGISIEDRRRGVREEELDKRDEGIECVYNRAEGLNMF
jgi:hypothetical protein